MLCIPTQHLVARGQEIRTIWFVLIIVAKNEFEGEPDPPWTLSVGVCPLPEIIENRI